MVSAYGFQDKIVNFYTSREEVKNAMRQAWPVLILFILFDSMQGVSAGLISGLNLL
jgi:Na+-driven multidrug efflux pump